MILYFAIHLEVTEPTTVIDRHTLNISFYSIYDHKMAYALSQEEIILAVAIAIFARTALYFWAKYNEKKALGEEIKFESKYIGTAIFAAVLSFFVATVSTEPVLALIPNAQQYSANGLFILIIGTAFSINEIANKVISTLGVDRILASNTLRSKFNTLLRLQPEPLLPLSEEIRGGVTQGRNISIKVNDKFYRCIGNTVDTDMSEEEIAEQEEKLGINLPRP